MGETYEVEVKVSIDSLEDMEHRILNIGAKMINKEIQIDSYFDHPCRTFQETDEALRVRLRKPFDVEKREISTDLVELTYKGPKIDTTTKTRLESSVELNNAEEITFILENLGFKLVAKITKKRQFFSLPATTISIDDVEDVGLFLELESIARTKDELARTKENIFNLMKDLGLDITQSIRESYLELYLGH
jgi:adenylate cyclase class 2